MNLLLLAVGGFTLGGLMITMVREGRELSWWERGLCLGLGVLTIYGITQLPDLGG
jgi:hypothetical protein